MTAWDPDAWTRNMIEDLRANGGTPSSGPLVGRPLAIMTSKGAKTGQDRTAIVTYHRDGDDFVIAATKGGADEHPAWYHNLVAHPEATFEAANDTFQVVARDNDGRRAPAALRRRMPACTRSSRRTRARRAE